MNVETALGTYLEIVDSCAPGLVEGLYVVGSFALDDWHEDRSDVDIIAITAEPATDEDARSLCTVHALLAEVQPRPFVDGPYLAWGDLITPPMSLHRPWTVDGEFHHDAECFELNPVTWFVLANHGVTVRGPTVDMLGTYVDIDARTRFVIDNLRGYWQPFATELREAASGRSDDGFGVGIVEWAALGPLRLHVTAFEGRVVSKRGAGEHGLDVLPDELREVVELALAIRSGTYLEIIRSSTLEAAADVIDWCVADVERAFSDR